VRDGTGRINDTDADRAASDVYRERAAVANLIRGVEHIRPRANRYGGEKVRRV
jgi:hypothetical protein